MTNNMTLYFQAHGSDNAMQSQVRGQYQAMFWNLDQLPNGPEKSVAIRKLLESMDAALRTYDQGY